MKRIILILSIFISIQASPQSKNSADLKYFEDFSNVADVTLLSGEIINKMQLDVSKDKVILTYGGNEYQPEQIGLIEVNGVSLLFDVFQPSVGGVFKKLIQIESDFYKHFMKNFEFQLSGSTEATYKLGSSFETDSRHIFSMNTSLLNANPNSIPDLYLKFENINIKPDDIKDDWFGIPYEIMIFPKIITEERQVNLPHLELAQNVTSVYLKIPGELNDIVLSNKDKIQFFVVLSRASFRYEVIAHFLLKNDFSEKLEKIFNVAIKQTPDGFLYLQESNTLTWESDISNVHHFNIYRGEKSAFGQTIKQEALVGSVAAYKLVFIDDRVDYYHKYFYKITAVKTDRKESEPSEEVAQYLDYKEYQMHLSNLLNPAIGGLNYSLSGITDGIGSMFDGLLINQVTDDDNVLINQTRTSQDGNFLINGISPVKPGDYHTTLIAEVNNTEVKKQITITVTEDPNKKHDVSVANNNQEKLGYTTAGSVTLGVNVSDDGEFSETVNLPFSLIDKNNDTLSSATSGFSLSPKQSVSKSQSFALSNLKEDYYFISATSNWHRDYFKANNTVKQPFFIVPDTKKLCFKLQEVYLDSTNNYTTSITGHTIKVTSGNNASISLSIDNIPKIINMQNLYIHNDSSFAVIPVFYGSAKNNVALRIGEESGELTVTPFDATGFSGKSLIYDFSLPSYYSFNNQFEFLFTNDTLELNSWEHSFLTREGLPYKKTLVLKIPSNENESDMASWTKVTDSSNNWWLHYLHVRAREKFDLAVSSITSDNQVPEDNLNIVGDNLKITVKVMNNSKYNEFNTPFDYRILSGDSVIHAETRFINLTPFDDDTETFIFPTYAQKPGTYKVVVKLPDNYDGNPDDNFMIYNINLIAPPQLKLDLSYAQKEAFIVTQAEDVFINVTANGTNVPDASVSVEMSTPEGNIHNFKCSYDISASKYKFPLYPVLGGIYNLKVKAVKKRHLGASSETNLPVYSYLYLKAVDNLTIEGAQFDVNVSTMMIGDLNGIAFDITYDPDHFKYLSYSDFGVFTGVGYDSQVLVNDNNGRLTVGITRLGYGKGVNINNKRGLINFHFLPTSEGTSAFEINNFSGISSKEVQIPFIGDESNASVRINKNTVYTNIWFDRDTLELNDTINAKVSCSHLEFIGSISGVIKFDTSMIKVLKISEGTLLNEYDKERTVFVSNVTKKGEINFGVVRESSKALFAQTGELLNFDFMPIDTGKVSFEFANLEILSPGAITQFNSEAQNRTVVATGQPNYPNHLVPKDSINLYFPDDTLYLNIDESKTISLMCDTIFDAFAFSGDIFFDPSHLKLQTVTEGTFLNENGLVSTSFLSNLNQQQGQATIGLSRLGQVGGVSALSAVNLLKLTLLATNTDTSFIMIPNGKVFTGSELVERPVKYRKVVIITRLENNSQTITINLKKGWNIFSSPVVPDSTNLKTIFQPMITSGSLVKIQDEAGNSLEDWGIFGGWQNNIGNISPTEGYKIKVNRNDSLVISGSPVNYPFAIPLEKGWNIAGYPLLTDFSGMNVVQHLLDKGTLIKVQDEAGNSIEDWGIFGGWQNNIGNFKAGEGYKIKVNSNETFLIFNSYPKSTSVQFEKVAATHFAPEFEVNGVDHMNINIVGLPVNMLRAGDEFAVYDGETCVGVVTIMPHHLKNQAVSIAASATDTQAMEGFVEGDQFRLKLWQSRNNQEFVLDPEIVKGTNTFTKHETTIASLEKYATTGLEGLPGSGSTEINCYPNPFRDEVTIEINLKIDAEIEVEILNQLGQWVKMISSKQQFASGIHRLIWNGKNAGDVEVAPGIYHLRIGINDTIIHRKIVFSN